MVSGPRKLPPDKAVTIHVDGARGDTVFDAAAAEVAQRAFYDACLERPDAAVELRVGDDAALIRRAGERAIEVTDDGAMLGFTHDPGGAEMKRFTLRAPMPLAERLEAHTGRYGVNAFIAEAVREKLKRTHTATADDQPAPGDPVTADADERC